MGLKGAGSYYQSQMTNTVFPDLLYKILEIYLDDILVYAKTKEELSENLKIVLNRLKKFGLTVNPDKVKINMNEVEYVLGFLRKISGRWLQAFSATSKF